MPFLPVPPAWIEAGLPTKEELFRYITDNQDSFNTDIEALKQTAVVDIIDSQIAGSVGDYSAAEINTAMPTFKSPVDVNITSVVVSLLEPSTSGVLAIDLERSTDNGANWSSVLSSNVELTGLTAGSISGAVNFINVAAQALSQNDLFRVQVSTLQVGQGSFHVSVYGELS